MAILRLTTTDGQMFEAELDAETYHLGRAEDNELSVPDDSVSGHHAELRRRPDGGYTVIDIGSTNGTKIDGARIETHDLNDGDVVVFGSVTAEYSGPQIEVEEAGEGTSSFELPEDPVVHEIADSSAKPATFASMSPFSSSAKGADLGAALLVTLAVIGMAALLISLGIVATSMS